MKQHASATQIANFGRIRLPRFLPEMIQEHVDGAGTAYVMRRDALGMHHLEIRDISRQEHLLQIHVAALAKALDQKLERRFVHWLKEPGPMTAEYAFVAAFLLLRCGRQRYETVVIDAWKQARRRLHRVALKDAMRLAGICSEAGRAMLVDMLAIKMQTTQSRHILHILSSSAKNHGIAHSIAFGAAPDDLVFEAMRLGLVAYHPDLLLESLSQRAWPPSGSLLALLAQRHPRLLNACTRSRVAKGQTPTAWELLALVATLGSDHQDTGADWRTLLTCLKQPASTSKILWALPYTGRPEAATHLLNHLSAPPPQSRSSRHSFLLLTGIDLDLHDQSTDQTEDALFLAEIKRHQLPLPSSEINPSNVAEVWQRRKAALRLAAPILLGRPRDLDALEQAFSHMTVRQWRGWLELIAIRSRGQVTVSHDEFLAVQWQGLKSQRSLIDAILFSSEPQSDTTTSPIAVALLQAVESKPSVRTGFV